jgi:hypothetical protein
VPLHRELPGDQARRRDLLDDQDHPRVAGKHEGERPRRFGPEVEIRPSIQAPTCRRSARLPLTSREPPPRKRGGSMPESVAASAW